VSRPWETSNRSAGHDDDAFFAELFGATSVMVILRGLAPEAAVARAEAAWAHGVRAIEVPVVHRPDLETLVAVVEAGRSHGAVVGAGSVYRTAQVPAVLAAGAAYTVAPGLAEDVSLACREAGLPHLPGVSTPSEVTQAERLGHVWLKAFPSAELGSSWITAMQGPFPWPRWVATGGITVANASAFLQAGARAVGMGRAIDDWTAAAFLVDGGTTADPSPSGSADTTKERRTR
jgi:2-dehydro-3-deoxyphosphogluconate aldolase/(4S)-4-hydroxy-2-oxoglutarate aldolase